MRRSSRSSRSRIDLFAEGRQSWLSSGMSMFSFQPALVVKMNRWCFPLGLAALLTLSGCLSVEDEAKAICERNVPNGLKAPSTASFPSDRKTLLYKDGSLIVAEMIANSYRHASIPIIEAFNEQNNYVFTLAELEQLRSMSRSGKYDEFREIFSAALQKRFKKSSHLVVGYVDAQNSYGAMLRTQFICMMTFLPDDGKTRIASWRLDGLMFANR